LALPTRIRQELDLSGTNAQAYYEYLQSTIVKRFITFPERWKDRKKRANERNIFSLFETRKAV
jgi:hypothetical protein